MIKFTPFWNTLKNSNESTYTLIKNHKFSSSTIDKLRHNKNISTLTITDLCRILNCKVEDILIYEPNNDDQIL